LGVGGELLIQHIRGDGVVVVTHGGALEPLAHARLEALFLHQANDTLPADGDALLPQVLIDARAAIPLLALRERRADQDAQPAVLLAMRRLGASRPRVIPTPGHP
jgi:hypothetical protein